MKTRSGFVSNSSSSSFCIALKRDVSIEEKIRDIFKLPSTHVMSDISHSMTEVVIKSIQGGIRLKSVDEAREEGFDDGDPEVKFFEEKKAVEVVHGTWGDDYDNNEEALLCNIDLNYEDDDIVIRHYGGY